MRNLLCITFLFIVFDCFSQEFDFQYSKDFPLILQRTQDENDKLYYNKQIYRFKENDTTLTNFEVLALMIGFTADSNYHAYPDVSSEREIYRLNDHGEFEEALKKGLAFNRTHPLNQMTLIELSYSYYKLGKQESANYYSFQFCRIMNAMAMSGNGRHPDSASFALTPIDGQNFIRKFLRGKIGTMGSGRDSNGNFVDILEYIPPDEGEEAGIPLYFQIQHAMKAFQKEYEEILNEPKKEKRGKKQN